MIAHDLLRERRDARAIAGTTGDRRRRRRPDPRTTTPPASGCCPASRCCSGSPRRCCSGRAASRCRRRRSASRPTCAATCSRTSSGCRSSFHDRWPSGQLLSRMTSDLSTLRRFTGFGFVFLIANTGTALVVVAAADPHPPVARPVRPGRDDAADHHRPPLRAALQRAGAARPGPHRRPRHLGRGVGARHPGDQVLRPPPAHARAASPATLSGCAAPSWPRSTRWAGSGRCSRATRSSCSPASRGAASRRSPTAR